MGREDSFNSSFRLCSATPALLSFPLLRYGYAGYVALRIDSQGLLLNPAANAYLVQSVAAPNDQVSCVHNMVDLVYCYASNTVSGFHKKKRKKKSPKPFFI